MHTEQWLMPNSRREAARERFASARLALLVALIAIVAALPVIAYVADRTGLPILPDCRCTSDSDCARKCGGFGDPEPRP